MRSFLPQGVFGAMGVVFSFPAERQLSLKERASGAYGASPYYLAKATVDVATYLPGPVVFSCCVYFLVGFQATAAKFFVFTGVMCLTTMATCALALATSALCRTVAVSVVVLPLLLEASRLCSGFYTWPAVQTPRWAWLDALSYVSYNYPSLLQNELAGLELSCSAAAPCPPPYAYVVKAGYAQRTIGENCLALAGYTLICHAAAYCGIRWLKH
jgi:ABC-type multidrug transport system permease subunit